jgi:hypothetical protein
VRCRLIGINVRSNLRGSLGSMIRNERKLLRPVLTRIVDAAVLIGARYADD